jgi:hypothetical protein
VKIKRSVLAGLFVVALAPVLALALIKPWRVAAPQLVSGVNCYDGGICTDDEQRLGEARALYSAALARISEKAGAVHSRPRVIFCSASPCQKGFGLGNRAAHTVGDFGIAVAPRGWQTFYLAHELIHYRQAEEFGSIGMLWKPKWLIEGMAYSLSDDPRRPLAQPFESWRAQFESWNSPSHRAELWQAAKNLK